MFKNLQSGNQKILVFLIVLPLAVFVFIRSMPALDWAVWGTIEYAQLVYFYLMAFISFMSLIAGLFPSDQYYHPFHALQKHWQRNDALGLTPGPIGERRFFCSGHRPLEQNLAGKAV
jgi:hypothetical protein